MLYVSPLKALAVDVERNLRAPLAGIARVAEGGGERLPDARDRDPHRRHAAVRARALPARAGRHPDHHAGVALPAADLERARGAARRSTRSSSTRSTRWCRPSAARTWRCRSSGSRRSARGRRSASACRRRSARSTRSRGFSAGRSRVVSRQSQAASRQSQSAVDSGRRRTSKDEPPSAEIEHEFASRRGAVHYRPVTIVDAGEKKALKLHDRSAGRGHGAGWRAADDIPERPGAAPARRGPSIWSAIHPRLLELIRAHRSTLIFVNSRRLAERLAGALNELAGETLVRSHHGSIARPQRVEIEDLLKAGALRALVATSSLELGIDMGAIDLVVQIEAPPSVASGLQRIGRGGHQVDADQRRRHLPEVPRRPGRLRRGRQGDARRRRRGDPLSAQPARHRRAADRRDGVDGRLGRRRAVRDDPARGAVRGAQSHGVRRRARHAVGPLSVRRVRRAAAARHLGSRRRHAHRARRREARRDRQRRHDSRPRAVRRLPRSAPARARRASASSTRRWCSRAASARRSCSAPRRGGSRRSRTTACSSRRRRASRARCRSGKAIAPGGRSSSGSPSAG